MLGHDTANSIVTQGALARMARQDMATIWPRHSARAIACSSARACAACLAGESQYKFCIVVGGNLLIRDTARDTADNMAACALRRGAMFARHGALLAMTRRPARAMRDA